MRRIVLGLQKPYNAGQVKIAISAILGLHMLLGNFCMMPMAFAQGMPMPDDAHDESMEMVMTPMEPMSPAHCDHCAKVTKQSDMGSMNGGSPCNSGHCFMNAQPATSAAIQSTYTLASVALPTAGIVYPPVLLASAQPPSTAPPQTVDHIRTVVLRF